MARNLFAALAVFVLATSPALAADNFVVKDGGGTTISKRSKDVGSGVQADANVLLNSAFVVVNPATSDKQPALGTAGAPASDVISIQGVAGGTPQAVDTASHAATTDRGVTITAGGTAQVLMSANAARRGFSIQNQSAGDVWINGVATATNDFHSLKIAAGSFFETAGHAGTGAISIYGATTGQAVYAREW